MIELLAENPVLTLFVIMAVGYFIGRVKLGNFSLGVAGALFAGIALSAFSPNLALPPIIYTLGLILFIYTTGISLGPTFFTGLRKTGLRDNLLAVSVIIVGAGLVVLSAKLLNIDGPLAAGMYTGTFTVTPALAGVLDALEGKSAVPVVGYSLAYPFSIVASLLLIGLFRRLWKIDRQEATNLDSSINPHNVHYLRSEPTLAKDLARLTGANITASRIYTQGKLTLVNDQTEIKHGDYVTIVGAPKDYQTAVKWMGKESTKMHLSVQHGELHERRVFVSNQQLAGKTIGQLQLPKNYQVVVTRIRRGDIDMVVDKNFVVELGDRLRMVGRHADIDRAASYLGDSYKSVSHFNVLSLAVGISLGVLIGTIAWPLPGGREISLGAAGGTIIVALVLGALRRTGPIAWQIPYATNLSIRQLGLMMFLAGVGSTAGQAFTKALTDPASYQMMAASLIIALITVLIMLVIGYRVFRIPYSRLSGMVAAMNTQPATLAYANGLTKLDDTNIGYASVYPMALIVKIIIAQILLILLT